MHTVIPSCGLELREPCKLAQAVRTSLIPQPHHLSTASVSANMPQPETPSRLRRAVKPFERPASYITRALSAASYPLRGIWYFLGHPAYYPLFLSRLLPLSLISILVYLILFTFTFLPQYAFLALFHGWGAWVNAVVLVLGEGLVIIQALFEGFFVDECRVDVFDVSSPPLAFVCTKKTSMRSYRHAMAFLRGRLTTPLRQPSSTRA
jgi:hypothetical protein